MGCDIHLYVEKKVNNKWEFVEPEGEFKWRDLNEWDIGRSYITFGVLAGVRNYDVDQVVSKRGIPEDCSSIYKDELEIWESDGHSHSFIYLNELLNYNWNQKYFGKSLKDFCYSMIELINILEELSEDSKREDVRIVFFFDN